MSGQSVTAALILANERGLHARASAKFVQMAERFEAIISVSKDGESVNATSIMGLMMLGAACGTQIIVSARGRDAETAMAALTTLVAEKFGEE